MQYTRYQEGQFYGWHNDAGLATQYKPVSVGNRMEGLGQDFVNENIEMVRKLSFAMQLSDPDDYEGGNVQLLDEEVILILFHGRRDVLSCSTLAQCTESRK